ncbi:MAG: hypothetical protein NTY63_05675 [Candidatus Bipolaricaulota bacterium]|nr:hypothetical protein [Candidatus Bipolaricaulota bacterium]
MAAEVGSYVELTDIFPEEQCSLETLRKCLSPLPLDLVLVMCARANQVLTGPRTQSRLDRQRCLANTFLTAETGARLNEVARRRDADCPEKTAFLTRRGLLELVRWALLLCDPDTPRLRGEWTQAEKDLFTKAALICSWASETKIRKVLDDNADIEALKDIALVFFRTALDAGLSGVDPWRVIGRGRKLFLEYLPRYYPGLENDFREAMGAPPLEYMSAAGALISMHLQLADTMIMADAVTLGQDTEYAAVYAAYQAHQISTSESLRRELWPSAQLPGSFEEAPGFSLKPFRTKPIIAMDDGRGAIPDALLLADSYMVGPLFQLLSVRNENEVFGAFGSSFEEYALDILAEMFPDGAGLHQVLHCKVPCPDVEGEVFEVDACLDYVDRLILVEAKAVFIPDRCVVECDEREFQRVLKEKYLYGERPVGVGQLARAIRALASGAWKGLDTGAAYRLVYPVLVVHDRLLQEPFVNEFLADLFVAELGAEHVAGSWQWQTDGLRFAPLTVVTIDDLEDLGGSAGIDLLELLEAFSAAIPNRRGSLHDFVTSSEQFRRELRINQSLAQTATSFLEDCSRRVFGREPTRE